MRVLRGPQLALLGPPVIRDEEDVPLHLQPKTLAVLAYVAMSDRAVPRRELAHLLFGDAEDPRTALRWHLVRLRAALPEQHRALLRVDREAVAFDGTTDAAAFRVGAERCLRTFEPDAARSALRMYRGDFLSGLAVSGAPEFDTWLFVLEESLRRLFRRLAASFGSWAIRSGKAEESLEFLARLVAIDPYAEDGHVLLVQALEAVGAHERARVAYDAYARLVRDDLHAEPRREVSELFETPITAKHPLPRDGFATLSEVTLHFVDWQGGHPPVLGLHGALLSGYIFSALAHHLAPEFRVVAPSRRGNGLSDKPPHGYSADRHVTDLLELMEMLGVARPVIVGHSAGGSIAALLAERCHARGLVLLDALVGERAAVKAVFDRAGNHLDHSRGHFWDVASFMQATRAEREGYSPDAELLLERVQRFHLVRMPDGSHRQNVYTEAIAEGWASIIESDTIGALRRLDCPVIIAWAAQPWQNGGLPFLGEDLVRAQLVAARHGELVIAERSNHGSIIRDPEPVLVASMRKLLRSLALKPAEAAPRTAVATRSRV